VFGSNLKKKKKKKKKKKEEEEGLCIAGSRILPRNVYIYIYIQG
jgi:hypothetical protein